MWVTYSTSGVGTDEGRKVAQEDEEPTVKTEVSEGGLVSGRRIEETPKEGDASSSVPVEATELVAGADVEDETIWSLLAKAGYMVWYASRPVQWETQCRTVVG